MKERELRALGSCAICGKKLLHAGLPLFWRVTVERFGVDVTAVQRQQGFTMMLGGSAQLAAAMGPDEDMAEAVMPATTVAVCEPCASGPTSVFSLGMRE